MSIISQFKEIIYRYLNKNTEFHTAGLITEKQIFFKADTRSSSLLLSGKDVVLYVVK